MISKQSPFLNDNSNNGPLQKDAHYSSFLCQGGADFFTIRLRYARLC